MRGIGGGVVGGGGARAGGCAWDGAPVPPAPHPLSPADTEAHGGGQGGRGVVSYKTLTAGHILFSLGGRAVSNLVLWDFFLDDRVGRTVIKKRQGLSRPCPLFSPLVEVLPLIYV